MSLAKRHTLSPIQERLAILPESHHNMVFTAVIVGAQHKVTDKAGQLVYQSLALFEAFLKIVLIIFVDRNSIHDDLHG
jgi:hypothetical protein